LFEKLPGLLFQPPPDYASGAVEVESTLFRMGLYIIIWARPTVMPKSGRTALLTKLDKECKQLFSIDLIALAKLSDLYYLR
jgi:hypothetical protein